MGAGRNGTLLRVMIPRSASPSPLGDGCTTGNALCLVAAKVALRESRVSTYQPIQARSQWYSARALVRLNA